MIFEEFVKDVKSTLKDVLNFLQVNEEPPENIVDTYNEFRTPRGQLSYRILNSKTVGKIIGRFSNKMISPNIRYNFS